MAQRDFRNKVLKVLREVTFPGSDSYKTVFQLIRWGDGDPVLEKRVYRLANDEWQLLKLKGFTAEDIELLQQRLPEILDVMDAA